MTELLDLIQPTYEDIESLPYRQGVIGIVQNSEGKYLIVQLAGYGPNHWRFPGGGLDEGESHQEALLRELQEELGSSTFVISSESPHLIQYEWPENVIVDQIKSKGRYFRGQQQKQFLVEYTSTDENLIPDPTEIKQLKWVSREELNTHFIFEGQMEQTEIALSDFGL